jgi:glucose/arabinose dehydrogenase
MKQINLFIPLMIFVLLLTSVCNQSSINTNSFRILSNGYVDSSAIQNYINYCAGCHGDNLEEFRDNSWLLAQRESDIIRLINEGDIESGMPAFRLTFTNNEINDLANLIIYKSHEKPEGKDVRPADSTNTNYYIETVVSGLDIPWGLEFLPNGDLLISERSGILYRFSKNKLTPIKGLPKILVKGQGGLMDIRLHPNYETNGWIYLSYSYVDNINSNAGNTAIMRGKIKDNQLTNKEVLYKAVPATTKGHHFGSRITFDHNNNIYFSVGDRGERPNGQDKQNSNGKIHRLTEDGKVPNDNPFFLEEGTMQSIYSFGHRNPQGVAMNPLTGEIWTHEHGPKGGDEVNLIYPGANYGWPIVSYGINYNGTVFTNDTAKEGMVQPLTYYVPSIAPCGMAFIVGNKYPGWENSLLIGSLRFNYIDRCVIENSKIIKKEKIAEGIGRVRNVAVNQEGIIYVGVENPGRILKLTPSDYKKK